jgi:hypothetical protein
VVETGESIPEKTADAGGNAYMRTGLGKMVRNQKDLLGLTKLTPALTAGLVESTYKLGLLRFGSVRFRGKFPQTLNQTVGPVRENPWTRTWTCPNGSFSLVQVQGLPEPEPDRKNIWVQVHRFANCEPEPEVQMRPARDAQRCTKK